jgi:hypothetical protein
VQDILIENHTRWLNVHGGIRPKRPESMHCSLEKKDLQQYKDNWPLIKKRL